MRSGKRPIIGRAKVYRFRLYDIAGNNFKISARMVTYACIWRIHAELIRRTEPKIDKKDLDADGMIKIGSEDREISSP